MRLGSFPDPLDVGLACVLEVVGKGLVFYPWSPGFQGEKSWLLEPSQNRHYQGPQRCGGDQ